MSADRIEKKIVLNAPLGRAWDAIGDSRRFGAWFGVAFAGPFEAGKPLSGRIVPTSADEETAKLQKPYEGASFNIFVDRIEPGKLFSFRWHPYAVEPGVDYSSEPATLVAFELKETPGGTLLTISESGFDQIPPARRAEAFSANEGGWATQLLLIQKYLVT